MEAILEKHGIPDEHIVMRVTGCPNGCGARDAGEWLAGKRRVATACILAAAMLGRVSHGCIKKISPGRIFWPRWMSTDWYAGRRARSGVKAQRLYGACGHHSAVLDRAFSGNSLNLLDGVCVPRPDKRSARHPGKAQTVSSNATRSQRIE